MSRSPSLTDFHQILHSCRSRGLITRDKLFSDRLRDVDSVGGVKNEGIPLTISQWLLTHDRLRNCTACDRCCVYYSILAYLSRRTKTANGKDGHAFCFVLFSVLYLFNRLILLNLLITYLLN